VELSNLADKAISVIQKYAGSKPIYKQRTIGQKNAAIAFISTTLLFDVTGWATNTKIKGNLPSARKQFLQMAG
jgi:hypothetical protein